MAWKGFAWRLDAVSMVRAAKFVFGLLVCTWAASGGQPRGRSVPGVASACWRECRPLASVPGGGGAALAACLPLLFGGCRTRQETRDAQGRLAAGATGPGTFDSRSTGCKPVLVPLSSDY